MRGQLTSFLRVFVASAFAFVAACGGSDSSGPDLGGNSGGGTTIPAASLSVASATVAVGGTIKREAWLKIERVGAAWKSDNPQIATIAADGTITGVAEGTTTIHATAGASTGSAEITVSPLLFKDLVVGGRQACAQSEAGTWYCWGDNGVATIGRFAGAVEICAGQRRACSTTPRVPTGRLPYPKLAIAGGGVSCGLTSQGDISCWGRDDNHVYFGGPTESCEIYSGSPDVPNLFQVCMHDPVAIPSSLKFVDIALGEVLCGITADRSAACWGANLFGQLGVPATGTCDGLDCLPSPGPIIPNLKFKTLSVGSGASCGIDLAGNGYCWGWNATFQRGADVPEGSTPNAVSGGHRLSVISIFRDHACAVSDGNDGYCWGLNTLGQLGVSNTMFSVTPVPQLVPGGLKFISVTPGLDFTCGLATDRFAYCWGNNANGQLGDGTTESRSDPQRVLGGHEFTKVLSGRHFTCGLTVAHTIYCWGSNIFGELGIGDPGNEVLGNSFRTEPVGLGGAK